MKNDEKIKELLAKIEVKKQELGVRPKASWNTNGIFKLPEGHVNLNAVKDYEILLVSASKLISMSESRAKAAELIGLDKHTSFVHDGYPIEDWLADFKLRVAILNWEAEKLKLDALQKKLDSLRSEEAKTEQELSDITSMLG